MKKKGRANPENRPWTKIHSKLRHGNEAFLPAAMQTSVLRGAKSRLSVKGRKTRMTAWIIPHIPSCLSERREAACIYASAGVWGPQIGVLVSDVCCLHTSKHLFCLEFENTFDPNFVSKPLAPPLLARRPLTLLSSKIWLRPFSRFCHARYFSRRGTEVVIKISSCQKLVQRLEREIFSLGSTHEHFLTFSPPPLLPFLRLRLLLRSERERKRPRYPNCEEKLPCRAAMEYPHPFSSKRNFSSFIFFFFPPFFPSPSLSISLLSWHAWLNGSELRCMGKWSFRLGYPANLQTCSVSHFRAWNSRRRSFSSAQLL